jgi:hypothetical protein
MFNVHRLGPLLCAAVSIAEPRPSGLCVHLCYSARESDRFRYGLAWPIMNAPEVGDDTSLSSCGCAALPRRRCDLCQSEQAAFLACSHRCLAGHIAVAHPFMVSRSSEERARAFYRDLNRRFPDTSDRYAEHRDRITALSTTALSARNICVFGAGNCSDVDLEALSRKFDQIHLVDLDADALKRSYERSAEEVRRKLTLHGDVDLSGMIDRLDVWGDEFPQAPELASHAVSAARSVVQRIGRTFDVALSTCVLSQLPIPFQRTWIMPKKSWANLIGAIRAVHLATLAGVTRSGGTGIIVFDALSSREAPALGKLEKPAADALEALVTDEVLRGACSLHPDPHELARDLASPGLAALVRAPRVTDPWLWNLGEATQLVYAIVFQRS